MANVRFGNSTTMERILKLEKELELDYLKFNLTADEVAVIENNLAKAKRRKLEQEELERFETTTKTVLGEGVNAIVYRIASNIYANLKRSDKTFFLQLL